MNLISVSFSELLALCFSCTIHLLFFGPAIYIIFLCAQIDYSLLIWHPICCTVGCCFLMTEAILSISGETLLVSKVSRASRIRIHWILHILGIGLMAVGLAMVIVDKYQGGTINPPSSHGKISRISIIASLLIALGGVLCMCKKMSLATLKVLHSCSGIISMILLLISQITGLYTSWWPGSKIGMILVVGAYVIGGFLLFIKPFYTTFLRIRGIAT